MIGAVMFALVDRAQGTRLCVRSVVCGALALVRVGTCAVNGPEGEWTGTQNDK